jgi:hypothetical protein
MLPALLLLLLGAPETDPAKLLKVAYASQYEWKEDQLKNVTLEFTYTWTWGPKTKPKDKKAPKLWGDLRGAGRIVVVGQSMVHGHYPDLRGKGMDGSDVRGEFGRHLHWILRRFVRHPFDAVFRDAKFQGPEETAFGQKVIARGIPFYVKQDKIVAREIDERLPKAKKPHMVLLQYEPGPLGGGYGLLGETCNYKVRGTDKPVAWTRKLTTKDTERAPVPLAYNYTRTIDKAKEDLTIEFDRVTVDSEHPVVLDPVARDVLKEAWERRFTLPTAMGIEGDFHRRPDKNLDKSGWLDVAGSFEIWGMNEVKVELPEGRIRDRGWRARVEGACRDHIYWIFSLLRATPFEKEFKNCGFELVPQGKEQVVQIYGYDKALAFKLADGAITGHYSRVFDDKGWWNYKVKRTSDGRFMLDRMKREFGKRKIELRFRYGRVRGFQLPKKFDVFAIGSREPYFGVAEYSFRRLKVIQ